MPENLNYALYFNILFLSILGFGMLFGFVKGYKKASYNFVVMLIFYVIFFLTLDLVSKFLWDMHIPGLGNLLGHFISELSGVSSLQDVVTIYSEKFLGDHLGSTLSNEEFQLFISGFSLFIVKLIYTIIYFSVLQTIYKFFASIIRIIFFRTKREKERPKRRFLGAGVGLLSGAMNVYALLIIMGGLMSISESATNLIPDQDATMMPLDELVTAYNQNMIVSALENDDVTNIPLNHKIFDFSYSFKYHDKNISIRKELRFAEGIYNIYVQSDFKTTKNYSDISGQEVRETFTILSESDLFPAVLPLGIELASDYLDVEMTMTIDELYEIDWDKEAMQLGEIAAVTLDLLNAAGIVGDSSANYETVIFEGDDLRSLFDSLSESNLATLAAFVAIEPVLEGASADIKAIITLPEGIVFEDEFKAIGQFAGAVADTGITIGDFKSGDPTLILTTLSEVDFTVIYNSKIISNALINVISGKTNYNTFDVFNVPEDTVWYDLYDDNGNLIQNGELKNILFAVNEIVQVSDNINFTELNLNVIADFSNETINIIFESKVMVATVSKLVTEMDLGNTPLVISDSVFDENNYIIKEELKALAKSARMVFTTLTCDEGTTCGDTGFDLSKAFDLTEEEIEILIASEIVSATIGDLIIEKGGDVLTIPNSSLITIYVKQVEKNIISKEEVTNMFKALSVLGITDIDNMNFDASIIKNLATLEDNTVLDQLKADKVFDSNILHATLSDMILDTTNNTILKVPYLSINEEAIRYTKDAINYISIDELNAVISALLVLDINDFADVESINLDLIINNSNSLLASSIIHATLSNQLFSLGTDKVIIPTVNDEGNWIRQHVGVTEQETVYINKTELDKLFDALVLIGMTNINSFDGTLDLSTFYNVENRNELLASAIMHATVSKQILDLGPSVLNVPFEDSTQNNVRITVGSVGQETEYVAKSEIHALIESLEIFNINDINNFTGTFNLGDFNDDIKQTTLLNSASIHATISKKLIDLEDSVLIVPMYTQLGEGQENKIQFEVNAINYIIKNEIKSIINALVAMGYTDLSSFGTSIDSSKFFTNREVLLLSSSIQATISNKMLSETNGKLIVPNVNINNSELIRIEMSDVTYIDIDEMNSIFIALELLGFTNFNAIDINPVNVFNADFDTLLASASVQATISDLILDNALDDFAVNGSNSLLIPLYFRNEIMVGDLIEKHIEKIELKAILRSMQILSVDDFNGGMNASVITTMSDSDLSTVLESGSVHVTIDNMLKGNSYINTKIPNLAQENVYNMTSITIKDEIKAFIKVADVLASDNFTTITFNISTIYNLPDTDRSIALDSMIVRNSVTVELEEMIDLDPMYSVNDTFYENQDNTTFFTKQGIMDILTHYNLV